MLKHWEHTEYVDNSTFESFRDLGVVIQPSVSLPANTGVFIECLNGSKRLEGVYDTKVQGIRPLKEKGKNRDIRLYLDAINDPSITLLAVDGLMGTGKTSSVIEKVIEQHLQQIKVPTNVDGLSVTGEFENVEHKVLIAKPYVNSGGEEESYGFLPGDINEKFDPTIKNFTQYFDRWHQSGFKALRSAGYVEILPLGFVRGMDAENMTIIADECQNTSELISIATRKANKCRIFFLGDTSPFQIDRIGNTPKKNGLTHLINLLHGAPYFQYIEMKSLEHILRSDEVRDIVRRLFRKHGENPQEWTI